MNSLTVPSSPTATEACWALSAQPDHEALLELQAFLAANRDEPICIEAEELRRPDTLLLQLLVAACRDWAARGLRFRVTGASDRVLSLLPLLGVEPHLIGLEAR